MSSTTDIIKSPAPALPALTPEEVASPELTYVLYYRSGNNPSPMQKFFLFKGDLQKAIRRGQHHCEVLGTRFISVRPFITSLENEEKRSIE